MKFDELKINQQVVHKDKKSTVVHLYKNDKSVVVTVNDDNGKPINLTKSKPQGLKPYHCEYFNKDCDASGLPNSALSNPCETCKDLYKNKHK